LIIAEKGCTSNRRNRRGAKGHQRPREPGGEDAEGDPAGDLQARQKGAIHPTSDRRLSQGTDRPRRIIIAKET